MTCIRQCLQVDVRNTVLVFIFSNSNNGRTSNIFRHSLPETMHRDFGCKELPIFRLIERTIPNRDLPRLNLSQRNGESRSLQRKFMRTSQRTMVNRRGPRLAVFSHRNRGAGSIAAIASQTSRLGGTRRTAREKSVPPISARYGYTMCADSNIRPILRTSPRCKAQTPS
jgi:hypothetical protein